MRQATRFPHVDIKRLWPLPILTAVLFLLGVWLFFEMGESAFLVYCIIYFALGVTAMLLSALITHHKKKRGVL